MCFVQENNFLTVETSATVKPRSLLPSISSLTESDSADFLDSPVKRHLRSAGIDRIDRNLVKLGRGAFGTVFLGSWNGKTLLGILNLILTCCWEEVLYRISCWIKKKKLLIVGDVCFSTFNCLYISSIHLYFRNCIIFQKLQSAN